MSWPAPGNDPWYGDNPDDNGRSVDSGRRGYYGINGIPQYYLDGTRHNDPSANAITSAIRNRAERESPIEILIDCVILDNVLITDVIITSDNALDNLTLFISLNEKYYEYRGNNGQADWYHALLKMIPDWHGTDFSIDADESREFEFELNMGGIGWHELEEDNLEIVCWVQSSNRQVLQAEATESSGYGGYFYGNVINNMTNEGVEGATVTINEARRSCVTGEDGSFAFERVPIEAFTVNVERWGYTTVEGAEFTFDGERELQEEISMLHPEIALDQEVLTVEIPSGESTTIDLGLENIGDGPLEFAISVRGTPEEGELWDQLQEINTGNITQDVRLQATIFFQDHFWVAGGSQNDEPNQLYKITRDGELVATYDQDSYSNYGWRNLTTDGEYLYGVDSTYIAQIDPEDGQVTGVRIPTPINPTYSVTWDAENNLFWVAYTTSDIYGIDREGNEIYVIDNDRRFRIAGLVYFEDDVDDYKLYILDNNPDDRSVRLWKCDYESGDAEIIDILSAEEGERAGGCSLSNELFPFTWALLVQMQAEEDWLRIYEASSDFYWLDINPSTANLEAEESVDIHVDFSTGFLPPNETYEAFLQFQHNTPVEGPIWVGIAMTVTPGFVSGSEGMPVAYGLTDVYPNPFNAVTNVGFNLDRASNVMLTVHDLTGRQVTELLNGFEESGSYNIPVNASDWPSGMYMVRLSDGSRVSMKKVALLK